MKKILDMLIPGLKLFLICSVAALSLGLINEVTEPVIKENKAREEALALKALFPSGLPSKKIVALPFVDKVDFESQILNKIVTDEHKNLVLEYYNLDSNTNQYMRKKGISLQDLLALSEIFINIEYKSPAPIKGYYVVSSGEDLLGYAVEVCGSGYGGDMKILAAYNADGVILTARLLDNLETPGLGKKAEDKEYMNKFIGKGGSTPVPVIKGMLDRQEDIDAITGATITFMGISNALKAGSVFVKTLEEMK